jgi:TRAP transporter TAXI family solute receptor
VFALLAAGGVKPGSIKFKRVPVERAADDLRNGKIDGFFVQGSAPIAPVDQLLRRSDARLLGVDAKTLSKVVRRNSFYSKITLPSGAYRGSKSTQVLGVGSLWLVNASLPSDTVNQILQAFWNRGNQAELQRRGSFSKSIALKKSTQFPNVPLHEGAKRFYAGQRS